MLPEGWAEVDLGSITKPESPICYGVLKPGDPNPGGVRMVRVTDIRANRLDVSQLVTISDSLDQEFSRSRVEPGDVLISVQGTVGRVAVVPETLTRANISRTIARLRVIDAVDPSWLWRAIQSPQFQAASGEETGGTTRDSLNIGALRELAISLPPLAEQRRIVAKLDALTARLARARAELERVPALVEHLKRQAMAACFHLASTTGLASFGTILKRVEAGKNMRCEERPPRARERGVVKVSAVTWGHFDPTKSKTLPDEYEPPEAARIRAGDLLISRANTLDLVGAVVLVDEDQSNLFLSDKILRLVVDQDFKKWVLWFLRSPSGRKQIEQLATGNQLSMRNISQDALRRIQLPFPNLTERKERIRSMEAAFARADRLEAEAASARALLDRLEAAILAKAFRGELVPQDPADEPASVLLDRIRAERAAAPKPKRGRTGKRAAPA